METTWLSLALLTLAVGVLIGFNLPPCSAFNIRTLPNNQTNCTEGDEECAFLRMVKIREMERLYHVEQAKQQILDKLRLHKRPTISNKISKEVFQKAIGLLNLTKTVTPDVKKYVSFSEKADDTNVHRLKFMINENDPLGEQEVTQLKLFIMVLHKRNGPRKHVMKKKHINLQIYQHKTPSDEIPAHKSRELVSSIKLAVTKSKWRKIVLPPSLAQALIQSGVNNSKQFLDLEIICPDCDNSVKPVLATKLKTRRRKLHNGGTVLKNQVKLNKRRPFLIVLTTTRKVTESRSKRDLECTATSPGCCKKSFYVDMRSIGWDDWVIEPRGYYANYCQGECSGGIMPNKIGYRHTSVIQTVKNERTSAEISDIKFCCSPRRMGSLSMIYLDDLGNVIKKDLSDMIVLECACF